MSADRIPQPGEVWTRKGDNSGGWPPLEIIAAYPEVIVYRQTKYADVQGFMRPEMLLRYYDPPKPKLPERERWLNVYLGYEQGHASKEQADRRASSGRIGVLRYWVDADGEPHIERVS